MPIAIIALDRSGLNLARKIQEKFPESVIFIPENLRLKSSDRVNVKTYQNIPILLKKAFPLFSQFIFIMATGIVVRFIAPFLKNKFCDPGVVVVDGKGRYALSLLGGHEGGANALAKKLEKSLALQAIITSKHEYLRVKQKKMALGIGCKRDILFKDLEKAILTTLRENKLNLHGIKKLATVDFKKEEKAIGQFSQKYGIPIEYFSPEEIRKFNRFANPSAKVMALRGVKGVCEPTALLGANNTTLLLPKKKFKNMTLSIAEIKNMDKGEPHA